jgi:hypothetical protein
MERIKINDIEYEVRREGCLGKRAYATVRKNVIIIKIPLSLTREEGFKIFLELRKKIRGKNFYNVSGFTK